MRKHRKSLEIDAKDELGSSGKLGSVVIVAFALHRSGPAGLKRKVECPVGLKRKAECSFLSDSATYINPSLVIVRG